MKRALVSIWLVLVAVMAVPQLVYSVEPDEVLKDPKLEARARALSLELRCLVCQNQSIDDSNAPLAKDLRVLVRERLTAGDTDKQVMDYIVARYGEFVLLKPRFAPHTYILWFSPFIFLVLGLFLAWRVFNRNKEAANAPVVASELSADEEAKLKKLLDD